MPNISLLSQLQIQCFLPIFAIMELDSSLFPWHRARCLLLSAHGVVDIELKKGHLFLFQCTSIFIFPPPLTTASIAYWGTFCYIPPGWKPRESSPSIEITALALAQ